MEIKATAKPTKKARIGGKPRLIMSSAILTSLVLFVLVLGSLIPPEAIAVDLNNVLAAPSLSHPFGTDWVGRDMLLRTLKGLSLSIRLGLICAAVSGILAVTLGILSPSIGGAFDSAVSFVVDLVLSIPHTLVVILISIASGGGFTGIVLGVAATHWTSLCRVIRAEVLTQLQTEYIGYARAFGKSRLYICLKHNLPHIIPQLVVGTVLVFPHAIIHEASVTFLGFGLPPHQPAIGVILAESMNYLSSGQWWLAVFPGLSLLLVSLLVSRVGGNIEKLFDASAAYKK